MLKGLFVNKTGMLIQQRRLEIAANNLANLNTIGFKKENIFFQKLVEALADPRESDGNRTPGSTRVDFQAGAFQKTGNPLDVAIGGEGFFEVQGDEGTFYTRNGSFRLDAQGRLVTADGNPVMSDGGEIQIAGSNATINEKGEILVDGQSVGRLKVVTFDDPQLLVKVGGTYFEEGQATAEPLPAEEIDLRPGYLEGSNVDAVREMVGMIELNREYELGQKAIKAQDDTLDKLINQAGRT